MRLVDMSKKERDPQLWLDFPNELENRASRLYC
jgi:hypothetical protein